MGLCRVLYVDDDPDIREIAGIALETVGGLSVRLCASGPEAIREAPAFEPDLIMLDVMMPDMDGPETLQSLRGIPTLEKVPAVFLTAKVHPEDIEHLRRLDVVDVLTKPFDPMTLAQTLTNIWAAEFGAAR